MMEIYENMVSFIPKKVYYNSEVHGRSHCRRVALLGTMLLTEMHGDEQDQIIFTTAALLHDIGRTTDWECQVHGTNSYDKATQQNIFELLPYVLSSEDLEIIRQMMVYHCIPDANIPFEKMDERTQFMVRLLKDADGLDRVRLGDLDTRYLRFDVSKKFVSIAKKLLETKV